MREQLNLLARRHPRYGYRRVHVLLQREGWGCNRKRVQRLWREEGLHVPQRKRRRKKAPRTPGSVTACRPDQVWALDYLFDATADGRPIKILNITDEYTREALACHAARSINADQTISVLERLVETRGRAVSHIRCDNGPELVAETLKDWCRYAGTKPQLHRARRTLAKPVRRVFQRPPAPRAARAGVLQQPLRSPDPDRRLATPVQPPPTTPIPSLPNPSSLRQRMACSPPTRTLITSGPKNGVTSPVPSDQYVHRSRSASSSLTSRPHSEHTTRHRLKELRHGSCHLPCRATLR